MNARQRYAQPKGVKHALGCMLGIAFLPLACGDFTECSRDINQKFLPADTTIAVGQQFTATVLVTTCDGRTILSSNPSWHSQDASVASVDSSSGRVTGLAPGATLISATGGFYTLTGGIPVTVR